MCPRVRIGRGPLSFKTPSRFLNLSWVEEKRSTNTQTNSIPAGKGLPDFDTFPVNVMGFPENLQVQPQSPENNVPLFVACHACMATSVHWDPPKLVLCPLFLLEHRPKWGHEFLLERPIWFGLFKLNPQSVVFLLDVPLRSPILTNPDCHGSIVSTSTLITLPSINHGS